MVAVERELEDIVLGEFEPEIAAQLVEFSKFIGRIDADYVIFMARKALRIYDMLVSIGGSSCEHPVLCDYVLDQDLSIFSGKRIALVDDTLIVGTTLARAVEKLRAADASSIYSYTFAADIDNWSTELITPDKVFVKLDHNRLLAFCAAEVSALGIIPMPYLADFPFSHPVSISVRDFTLIEGSSRWNAHKMSSPDQEMVGSFVHTLLPRPETLQVIESGAGKAFYDILDIIKIRAFSRKIGTIYTTTFVPVVTLRPISADLIDTVFLSIIKNISEFSGVDLSRLATSMTNSTSRLRFIQYSASIIIGNVFFRHLRKVLNASHEVEYSQIEASRQFGPWLSHELDTVHNCIYDCTIKSKDKMNFGATALTSKIPDVLVGVIDREYKQISSLNTEPQSSRSIFTDLTSLFTAFYKECEIPARKEVVEHGKGVFSVSPERAPFRDRLSYGYPWEVLATRIRGDGDAENNSYQAPMNKSISAKLSLLLDYLVDLGIAVPIVCNMDGVVFRAYRHGEDVLFADQEMALMHHAISGYMQYYGKDEVFGVVLEKIMACVIRVGVEKKFLKVVHGLSGTDGIARIGFHLHGAVPILPPHNDTVFADNRQSWLSGYLVDKGVLTKGAASKAGTHYKLGLCPEAALITPNARSDATNLGRLIGLLHKALPQSAERKTTGKTTKGRTQTLTTNKLILLATCVSPRDSAAAVAAEINVFKEWIERKGRYFQFPIRWDNASSIDAALNELVKSNGYAAINSARLKFVGCKSGAANIIANDCYNHLASLDNGEFLADQWRGYWAPVLNGVSENEKDIFNPWLDKLGRIILDISLLVFAVELALHSGRLALADLDTDLRFKETCAKIRSFVSDMQTRIPATNDGGDLVRKIEDMVNKSSPMKNFRDGVDYARKKIKSNIGAYAIAAAQVSTLFSEHGKMLKRVNFSDVIWYDIIDSTGEKSGLAGADLRLYRENVRGFKDNVNKDIQSMSRAFCSDGDGTILYPWYGTSTSSNDEKHIFICSDDGPSLLSKIVDAMLGRASVHRVRIRILCIRCDFAGPSAFKYEADPEVYGETFWEHLSRVKKRLREYEDEISGDSSVLFVGSPRLVNSFYLDSMWQWSGCNKYSVRTVIENNEVITPVIGGAVMAANNDE